MVGTVAVAGAIFAGLLVAVGVERFAAQRAARRHRAPGTIVHAAGGSWHVVRAGRGSPAVVFEAGIAASSISWSKVQPIAAGFTDTLSYDRAGYAWSPPAAAPRTAAQQTDELLLVLATAGIAPPWILVAHSFGALIAILAAHRRPDAVGALVFVDGLPPSEWAAPDAARRRVARGGRILARVGQCLAACGLMRLLLARLASGAYGVPRATLRSFGPTVTAAVERVVGEVIKLPHERLPEVRAHWSASGSYATMARHFGGLIESSRQALAVRSLGDLPIVAIAGAHLDPAGLERQRELARLSTRGRLVVAPRGGHWVHLDDPGFVADTVREVLDEVHVTRGGLMNDTQG
jgi:pimeloyl-ACP methyl ester carboxylesterase